MKRFLLCVLAIAGSTLLSHAQTITAAEYFIGADPGIGSGTPITVSSPGAETGLNWVIATGSLAPHQLHRVNVRVQTNGGHWSTPHQVLLTTSANDGVAHLITQMEYAVDNGDFTPVDVPDGTSTSLNELVATTGLANGLHRLRMRATDELGRTAVIHEGFLVVSNTAGFAARQTTQLEYWIDSAAPTVIDIADAPIVDLNEIVSTTGLEIGLHSLNVRATDDLGRASPTHRAFLIVSSPFVGGIDHTIVAAEYFVNVDPGEGNGGPIPLPDDALWDESEEESTALLTTLPVGFHFVGVRLQDDTGRWSKAVTDTILVGPILVVHRSGSNLVLNWQSGPGVDHFDVYRANQSDGAFSLIHTTPSTTYTDTGILLSADERFYNVTFTAAALSTYRLPSVLPVE